MTLMPTDVKGHVAYTSPMGSELRVRRGWSHDPDRTLLFSPISGMPMIALGISDRLLRETASRACLRAAFSDIPPIYPPYLSPGASEGSGESETLRSRKVAVV
jgi:hypothetical protein